MQVTDKIFDKAWAGYQDASPAPYTNHEKERLRAALEALALTAASQPTVDTIGEVDEGMVERALGAWYGPMDPGPHNEEWQQEHMRAALTAALKDAPLYAAPQPASVADGFVLVPVEPTGAMQAAAQGCWDEWQNGHVVYEIWPAMIEAARGAGG